METVNKRRRVTARMLPCISAFAMATGCAQMGSFGSEEPVDEAVAASLQPGLTRQELVALLGPPAEQAGFRRLNETVASWRLVEFGNRRMLFNAHFNPTGVVKYYSRTMDPKALGGGRRG
jgi:hypothetical protein